jgi:hypothetical protein
MDDLVAFIKAQLDKEEQQARELNRFPYRAITFPSLQYESALFIA